MTEGASREPARDPQDLERFLLSRRRAEDIDGMMAFYEPDAVADIGADLAPTSTRLADGAVTARPARRQGDGSWLWIIDRFSNA